MRISGSVLSYLSFFILSGLIFCAIFAPFIAPFSPYEVHEGQLSVVPSFSFFQGHFLGTDDIGRDILSRLIYGSRISLLIGFAAVGLALCLGVVFGMLAGFYGGWVDSIISRATDSLMSLPSMLFAMVLIAVLGPSLQNTIIAVGIVAIPQYIRIVRAKVLEEKSKEYIEATENFGMSSLRVMSFHVFPNILSPIIIQASLGFSESILNAAALGFLGLGAQAPLPEWGVMLSDGRLFIESMPWLVASPGLCILFVVLAFNILGDVLRDRLDPALRN